MDLNIVFSKIYEWKGEISSAFAAFPSTERKEIEVEQQRVRKMKKLCSSFRVRSAILHFS